MSGSSSFHFAFCIFNFEFYATVCATSEEASALLSNSLANDSSQPIGVSAQPRRALVIANTAGLGLQQQLTASGYVTQSAMVADAPRTISEFNPDIIIMVVAHAGTDAENEEVALARKLRAETATYALPIVFAWTEDERS